MIEDFSDLDDIQFSEDNANLPVGAGAIGESDSGPTTSEIAVRVVPMTILLAILVLAYFWLRGTRGLTPSTQMYTKLSRGATWGGVRSEAALTPNEYAERVASNVSGSRQPVTYLTDLYVRETYGTTRPSQSELLRARQAWLRLRGLLLRHLFTRLMFWRSRKETEYDDESW